jgi:hypothetical protein
LLNNTRSIGQQALLHHVTNLSYHCSVAVTDYR